MILAISVLTFILLARAFRSIILPLKASSSTSSRSLPRGD